MTGRQGQSLPNLLLAPEKIWFPIPPTYSSRERNGEGDRAKAMALIDESLAISSELGMRPLMERVLSRRERGQVSRHYETIVFAPSDAAPKNSKW